MNSPLLNMTYSKEMEHCGCQLLIKLNLVEYEAVNTGRNCKAMKYKNSNLEDFNLI